MIYNTVITLTLCISAFALPLQSRDASTIMNALGAINIAVQQLDVSAKAVRLNPNTATALIAAGSGVQNSITSATQTVSTSNRINAASTRSLVNMASGLITDAQTAISDLTAKKTLLDLLGASPAILQSLQAQVQDQNQLQAVLLTKVPNSQQASVSQSVSAVTAAIQQGVIVFGG
jgi:hypothetical protein